MQNIGYRRKKIRWEGWERENSGGVEEGEDGEGSVYKTIINPRMPTQESHAKSYEEICLCFEWIIPESILFSFEQGMDLLRLWRAPPLSGFSQTMGAGEKMSLFLFQMIWLNWTDT